MLESSARTQRVSVIHVHFAHCMFYTLFYVLDILDKISFQLNVY